MANPCLVSQRVSAARQRYELAHPPHVDHEECWCEPVVYPKLDGTRTLKHRRPR